MTRRVAMILLAVLLFPAAFAADIKTNPPAQLTASEVKKLARTAHTPDDYSALAAFYAERKRAYKQKATEEMDLWVERAPKFGSLNEKWPRPLVSTRDRYVYFHDEAVHAGELARKYSAAADAMR